MNTKTQRKKFKFYIVVGLLSLVLRLFSDAITDPATFWERGVNVAWLITYLTFNHYVLFEYTLPFIRRTWKKYYVTPLLLVIHFLFYSLGLYAWRAIGITVHIFTSLTNDPSIEEGVTRQLPLAIGSIVFFGLAILVYNHFKLRQAAQQLKIEKQAAELNYLKSQTNPHFLFNTLNNLYALSLEKSDQAPESILRLSKILRFMLYETSGNFIAVEQELKIIDDYIQLEKLRYDNSLSINFSHDVEDMKQGVPPLILMPLIENAFKHGVSETRTTPFINIHLSIRNRKLSLVVSNSVNESSPGSKVVENIGLSNLRRQLELLYTDYHLSVSRENHKFTASLTINLASHVQH